MVSISLKMTASNGVQTRLLIDGTPVTPGAIQLSNGEHALNWFVLGAPGHKYTLEVSQLEGAAFQQSATLDASGRDSGLHWFTV